MSELQFPKDPLVGQEYDFPPYKYYWDGTKWKTKGIGYNPVNDLRNELEPRISTSESKISTSEARISNTESRISNNESKISDNESKVFEALRRSYAEAGLNLVDGSFEEGGTLTSTSDVLLHKVTGIAYSWNGTLPITVAPNSTPTPLGAGGWLDQSDATLRSYVTAHEAKEGAHAISGVVGLQAALDGKASASELSTLSSSVAAINTKVTTLETGKSYCLVNALGTGAPNELISAALPATIAINTRYVLANPFGVNVPVECVAEIFVNSRWSSVDGIYNQASGGIGAGAFYVQGVGIVLQTGSVALMIASNFSLSGHGVTCDISTPVPCRVFIQKLGA